MDTSVKQAVKEAVAKSPLSMKEAARIANIPYTSFIRYAQELGIYHPNPQHKGVPRYGRQSGKCIPLEEILDGKHPHYNTQRLKKRLLATGIKQNRCEGEGCTVASEWNGKPLVLTLDHMDGDNTNHRLENIRLLCPNCHSQTENYCGRNADQSNRRSISDEQFVEALQGASNMTQALRALGLPFSETWFKRAKALIAKHNIEHLIKKVGEKPKSAPKYGRPEDYHRAARERYILSQQPYVQKVLKSGIDFSKHGWVTAIAPIINQQPQKVHKWMQTMMPKFYEDKCFKRKPHSHPKTP